jgi:hypothetical protein
MAEIIFSNQPFRLDSLDSVCGKYPEHVMDINGSGPSMLVPFRPYLLSEQPSGMDRSILLTMNHVHNPQDLTNIALAYGGDNTVAIAEVSAKLREAFSAGVGAATGVYVNRMEGFAGTVQNYQDALLEYRAVAKSDFSGKMAAKKHVVDAFEKMQKGFQSELSAVTSSINAHSPIPLNNAARALRIADNNFSKNALVKLRVLTQVKAHYLIMLGKYGKYLGQGVAVIDFGGRVGNIKNSFDAGGNWERDMFIESTSFAASAGVAEGVAVVGGAGLTCLVALTPPGWVLVIAGLAVAGVTAGASIWTNKKTKEKSGATYDSIMKWMGSR